MAEKDVEEIAEEMEELEERLEQILEDENLKTDEEE